MPMSPDKVILDRRHFLTASAAGAALLGMGGFSSLAQASGKKEFGLPKLPYDQDALAPHISARTMSFHYGKHHAGYAKKLQRFAKGTEYEGMNLLDAIRKSYKAKNPAIFNNAAQVFNHTFFWHSMKPGGGGQPSGMMLERINKDFGSYDKFREAFSKAAATQFASGWAWLVQKDGKLSVMQTGNADTPVAMGIKPLLTIDVWEHAYYLDYQNRRGDFIKAYLDHLVNWEFAAKHLGM